MVMEKEYNFKWIVYALLFLILYYVSKDSMYLWFSCISGFIYGTNVLVAIIIDINKYRKDKKL